MRPFCFAERLKPPNPASCIKTAEGLEIDQTSAWNAWEMGATEYENGNGESLELLIDAADYLDRNPYHLGTYLLCQRSIDNITTYISY